MQPQSIAKELGLFARSVEYLHKYWLARLIAAIILLYLAPVGQWRSVVVVVLTLITIPLICSIAALYCHQHGLWHWIVSAASQLVDGAVVRLMLGVDKLRSSVFGETILYLALGNLLLVLYVLYCHIDFLCIVADLWAMLVTLFNWSMDPLAIMVSFQQLLRTLAAYDVLEWVRTNYVARIIVQSEYSLWAPLVQCSLVSVVLFILSTVAYGIPDAWHLLCKLLEGG